MICCLNLNGFKSIKIRLVTFQYSMQINILGLSAVAFFILFSTSFLLILFVKTESQQVSGLGKPKP